MKDPGLERRHRGHRLRARLGCVPQSRAAAGLGWGGVVLAGGGVFIAGAEWEARRPARLTLRFSRAAGFRGRALHPHPT